MDRVIAQAAAKDNVTVGQLSPDAWLQDFYDQRKGSGKTAATVDARQA
jgi:type IV secretion system protein VirB4